MWEDGDAVYKVMVSDDGQYAIWLVEREDAPGWRDAGKRGTKVACLSFIDEVRGEGNPPQSPEVG